MSVYVSDGLFPLEVAKDSSGGPAPSIAVHEGDNWNEERSRRNPVYRWEYEVGIGKRHLSVLDAIYRHVLAVGVENSFPYLDAQDFTSNADGRTDPTSAGTDQVLGIGDGTNAVFQLIKTYTFGSRTYVRSIKKPIVGNVTIGQQVVSSSVVVTVDGVVKTSGTHYLLDTSTGQIVFQAGQIPGNGAIVSASFRFFVPVRYGKDFKLQIVRSEVLAGNIVSVPLVEDLGVGGFTPEFLYLGSGDTIMVTSSQLYTWDWGTCVFFVPNADGYSITLPDINDLPFGGPIFTFVNSALTGTKILTFRRRDTGASVFTLPHLQSASVFVRKDSGARVWEAY